MLVGELVVVGDHFAKLTMIRRGVVMCDLVSSRVLRRLFQGYGTNLFGWRRQVTGGLDQVKQVSQTNKSKPRAARRAC